MIGLLRYKSLVVEVSSTYLKRVIALESIKSSVSLPLSFDGFVLYRNTPYPVISEKAFESFLHTQKQVDRAQETKIPSDFNERGRTQKKNSARRLFALIAEQKNLCALPVDEVLTIIDDDSVSFVHSQDADFLLDVPELIEHITSRKGQ